MTPAEVFLPGAGLTVGFQSFNKPLLFLGPKKSCRLVWKVVDHEIGQDPNQNSGQSFQYEDPSPALLATNTVHFAYRGGKKASKRSSKGC